MVHKWRDGRRHLARALRLISARRSPLVRSPTAITAAAVGADLRQWGWKVSKKTVEASMARQGLVGRPTRRRFRS